MKIGRHVILWRWPPIWRCRIDDTLRLGGPKGWKSDLWRILGFVEIIRFVRPQQ